MRCHVRVCAYLTIYRYARYNILDNPHKAVWGVVNDLIPDGGAVSQMMDKLKGPGQRDILRTDSVIPAYYSRNWLQNHDKLPAVLSSGMSESNYPFLEASSSGLQAGVDRLIHYDQGRLRRYASRQIRAKLDRQISMKRQQLDSVCRRMTQNKEKDCLQLETEILSLQAQRECHGVFLVRVIDYGTLADESACCTYSTQTVWSVSQYGSEPWCGALWSSIRLNIPFLGRWTIIWSITQSWSWTLEWTTWTPNKIHGGRS
jgi:hypothetical protein